MVGKPCQIFSQSSNKWFDGEVTKELKGDHVRISYGEGLEKDLHVNDSDLRMTKSVVKSTHFNDPGGDVQVGKPCQIFSKSSNKWFDGTIKKVLKDGNVRISYGEGMEKDLHVEDSDLQMHHQHHTMKSAMISSIPLSADNQDRPRAPAERMPKGILQPPTRGHAPITPDQDRPRAPTRGHAPRTPFTSTSKFDSDFADDINQIMSGCNAATKPLFQAFVGRVRDRMQTLQRQIGDPSMCRLCGGRGERSPTKQYGKAAPIDRDQALYDLQRIERLARE